MVPECVRICRFKKNSSNLERAPKMRDSVLLNSWDSFLVTLPSTSSKTCVIYSSLYSGTAVFRDWPFLGCSSCVHWPSTLGCSSCFVTGRPPSDKVCPSSPLLRTISEKMKSWNSNQEITNAGAPQTTSTSSPSICVSLPPSSSVSP